MRTKFREFALNKDFMGIDSRQLGLTKNFPGIYFRNFGLPRISRKLIFANATSTMEPSKGYHQWLSEKVIEMSAIERCPM